MCWMLGAGQRLDGAIPDPTGIGVELKWSGFGERKSRVLGGDRTVEINI